MMQHAYIDESFELVFEFSDPKNPDRKVDEASYRILAQDGAIVQAGTMSIDEDGKTGRFRFNATTVGINTIEVSWSMGLDRFKAPHLISVEEIRV